MGYGYLAPTLIFRSWARSIPQLLRSEPGSIPIGAIVETGTAWAVPAAEKLAVLFLRADTERHLVGISVGIERGELSRWPARTCRACQAEQVDCRAPAMG